MNATAEAKYERARSLAQSLESKRDAADNKYNRARTDKSRKHWFQIWQRYPATLYPRTRTLLKMIRDNNPSPLLKGILTTEAEWARKWAREDYDTRLKRKAERRQKFLTTHTYGPWFMSNSLGADYGTFTCSCCGREFYHSPSTIRKAGREVYHTCCGHCTNSIIHADHGAYPYQ